jgi:hypothetical protein
MRRVSPEEWAQCSNGRTDGANERWRDARIPAMDDARTFAAMGLVLADHFHYIFA